MKTCYLVLVTRTPEFRDEVGAEHVRFLDALRARDQLLKRRRTEFADQYVRPLMTEAQKLGITAAELTTMIRHWEDPR